MKEDIFNCICLMNYLDESNKIDDYKKFFNILLKRYIQKRDNTNNFIYRVYNNEIIIFSDADKDDSLFIWTIYPTNIPLNDPVTGIRLIDFNLNTEIKFIKDDDVYYGRRQKILCIDIRKCVELLITQNKLKPIITEDLTSIYFYDDSMRMKYIPLIFEYTTFPFSTFDNISKGTKFLDGFVYQSSTL